MRPWRWLQPVSALLMTAVSSHCSAGTPPTARTPVILELFTSQSCSSCPPAEDLAQQLVRYQPIAEAEVILLAFHVDYWDQLGWRDPYSSAAWTDRQSRYATLLGEPGRVYTPEAVIDGAKGVVGSNSGDVRSAIRTAAAAAHLPLQLQAVRDADAVKVSISSSASIGQADFWVALVEDNIVTAVRAGENGGSRLYENGVVLSLERATAAMPLRIALPKIHDGPLRIVGFVRQTTNGHIVAAAQQTLSGN